MRVRLITDREIRALPQSQSGQQEYSIAGTPGLSLRVGKKHKDFDFRAVDPRIGKQVRRKIGRYPGMSLKDARKLAALYSSELGAGRNPFDQLTTRRHERAEGPPKTRQLISEFTQKRESSGCSPEHLANQKSVLNNFLLPTLGDTPVVDIRPEQIEKLLESVAAGGRATGKPGGPSAAYQLRQASKSAFALGWKEHGLPGAPPTSMIRAVSEPRIREVVHRSDELQTFFGQACDLSAPIGELPPQIAVLTTIFLLKRGKDIVGMRPLDLDLKAGAWRIPSNRTKAKIVDIVALTPFVTRVLGVALRYAALTSSPQPADYVFPSSRKPGCHIGRDHLSKKYRKITQEIVSRDETPNDAKSIAATHLHDFRSTGVSWLSSQQIPEHVCARILGHKPRYSGFSGAMRHYNFYEYLEEKRAALERWEAHLHAHGLPKNLPELLDEKLTALCSARAASAGEAQTNRDEASTPDDNVISASRVVPTFLEFDRPENTECLGETK